MSTAMQAYKDRLARYERERKGKKLAGEELTRRSKEAAPAKQKESDTSPTMRKRVEQAALLKVACVGTLPTRTMQALVPEMVDAILREMLEPSEGMVKAVRGDFGSEAAGELGVVCYRAMIQHILNETQD